MHHACRGGSGRLGLQLSVWSCNMSQLPPGVLYWFHTDLRPIDSSESALHAALNLNPDVFYDYPVSSFKMISLFTRRSSDFVNMNMDLPPLTKLV